MGNSLKTLRREYPENHYPSDKNIKKFSEITYFSPKDVEYVLYSFLEAWSRHVQAMKDVAQSNNKKLTEIYFDYIETRVPLQYFKNLEFNPFLPEMAQVFINENGFGENDDNDVAIDPSRGMLFLEYLDLLNVMHPEADFELKSYYAFEIFSRVEGTQNVLNPEISDEERLNFKIERIEKNEEENENFYKTISPKQIITISNRLTGEGLNGKSRLTGKVRDDLRAIIEQENEQNGISKEGIDIETFKKMLGREQNFLSSFTITV